MKVLPYFSALSTFHPAILTINYNTLVNRKINIIKNKFHSYKLPCAFCHGSGYISCRSCSNGCWKCQDSTLEECPYCSGGGKGRFCLNPTSLPTTYVNKFKH